MYCRFCGAKLEEGSIFCHQCGKKTAISDNHVPTKHSINQKGDFIVLMCPSCGGSLEISSGTNSLKCKYCGLECIIRRESGTVSIEAFACCPTCHRNDKTVKASLKYGSPKMILIEEKTTSNFRFLLIPLILLIPLSLCVGSSTTVMERGNLANNNPGQTIDLVVGILLIIVVYIISRHNRNVDIENDDIRKSNAELTELFKKNQRIWNRMYYCSRDGSFFDLKDSSIISKQEIQEKLFPGWKLGS